MAFTYEHFHKKNLKREMCRGFYLGITATPNGQFYITLFDSIYLHPTCHLMIKGYTGMGMGKNVALFECKNLYFALPITVNKDGNKFHIIVHIASYS